MGKGRGKKGFTLLSISKHPKPYLEEDKYNWEGKLAEVIKKSKILLIQTILEHVEDVLSDNLDRGEEDHDSTEEDVPLNSK